jgi:hypothetical protein
MRRRLLVLLGSTSPPTTDRIPFSRPFPAPHREGGREIEAARERKRESERAQRGSEIFIEICGQYPKKPGLG